MRRNKQYAFLSAFFNHFRVFLNLLTIVNRSGKFSDLWEVHVDSFANIWMLLDNVSDLLHDLSVKLTKFTDIKIFLWRKYINTETRNWQLLEDNVLIKKTISISIHHSSYTIQDKVLFRNQLYLWKKLLAFQKLLHRKW